MARQTLKMIVLTTLLALVPVLGWAGALDRGPMQQRYNPAAESMIRVPGVVGLYEQQALATLQQAGLTVSVRYEKAEKGDLAGKEFTVIDQEPGTAGVAMLGSTVTITVYTPPGAVQPDPYGQGGYYGNGGDGGYQRQPGGYYDDGSGNYQPQGGYYDGGSDQQPSGGYDAYGNPLPAEQAPVPWGGGGRPSGGSSLPAETSPAAAPGQPTAPVVRPDLSNDVRTVPPSAATPVEPVVATPVAPSVTPVQTEPVSSRQPSPIEQRLDEKVPARSDIRDKMKGVEKKITPKVGATTSPSRQPAAPAVTPAGSGSNNSSSAPIQATAVRPALTPVTQQGGTQGSGTQTFQATPVLPTATQAGQSAQAPAPILMTPVQQTLTPVSQGSQNSQPQQSGNQPTHVDGECRSWTQVSSDIYQRVRDEMRNFSPATVRRTNRHLRSDRRVGPFTRLLCSMYAGTVTGLDGHHGPGWAANRERYDKCIDAVTPNVVLTMNNLLLNFWNSRAENSWKTIGPRKLVPNETHKGRLLSTGGRVFISPYPINSDSITLSLKKISGRARTGVTVCSYDDAGNQTNLWSFQVDRGRNNKGQVWTKTFNGVGAKIVSVHLDSKSATDTFQYELRANIGSGD